MTFHYPTLAVVVVAFIAAGLAVRIVHAIVHHVLDAIEIVGSENRAAVQARARQLMRAMTALSFGLAAIFPSPDMRTAEGIGIGSTFEQAQAAYPDMPDNPQTLILVAVPGNSAARYAISVDIDKTKSVRHLQIQLGRQDCGG